MGVPPSLKQSARRLTKDWRFTLTAVVTLAVAMAANTVVFGAAYTVLLRPLPMANSTRLYVLWNAVRGNPDHMAVAAPEYLDYRDRLRTLDGLSAFRDRAVNLTGTPEPLRLAGVRVTPNLGRVLGIVPILGRDFDAADADTRVAIVSHRLWVQLFGGDRGIVGRELQLDGEAYTVVGVLPRDLSFPDASSFHMPKQSDVWLPVSWEANRRDSRGNQILRVIGAARAGTAAAAVQQDVDRVAGEFSREHPDRYTATSRWQPVVVPFREELTGASRPGLLMLAAAAGLVLAVACGNIAHLLVGRGAARRKEFGIKSSLGASRRRLVRDFASEAAILAALALVVSTAVSFWAMPVLAAAAPESLPHISEMRLDGAALLFAAVMTAVVVFIVGVGPALRVSGGDLRPTLQEDTPDHRSGWRWTRRVLVTAQVATAFLVVALAGLFLRTLVQLDRADLGFSPDRLLATQLTLPAARYTSPEPRAAFYRTLLDSLRADPRVAAAGLADPLPLSGEMWSGSIGVEGVDVPPGAPPPHAEYYRVSDGYFAALRVPIVAGREFEPHDDARGALVVMVDETFAATYWPGSTAIGRRLNLGGRTPRWATIVGVAGRVRRDGPRHTGEPQVYLPYFQSVTSAMHVIVRSSSDAASAAPALRRAVRDGDSSLPVSDMVRVEELAVRATAPDRFNLILAGVFAACALLLAAVGLYGMVSYLVVSRTREIGIRLALGSTPGAITRGILAQSGLAGGAGLAIGLVVLAAGSRALSSLLFGVTTFDGPTIAAAAGITALIALAATWLPARRILEIDPSDALRR